MWGASEVSASTAEAVGFRLATAVSDHEIYQREPVCEWHKAIASRWVHSVSTGVSLRYGYPSRR